MVDLALVILIGVRRCNWLRNYQYNLKLNVSLELADFFREVGLFRRFILITMILLKLQQKGINRPFAGASYAII